MLHYAASVPLEEIRFVMEAHQMNLDLFREGLSSTKTVFVHHLLKKNGGEIISSDPKGTASLLCNGAIEARVIGLIASPGMEQTEKTIVEIQQSKG